MSLQKYIYLRPDCDKKDGKVFANIHVLVGYNQGTIKDFQDMAAIMRKDFSEVEDKDVCCGKVHKSSRVDNFSIATWQTYVDPKKLPKGWHVVKDGHMEYYW